MNFWKAVYPERYSFIPFSFILPKDEEKCKRAMDESDATWICKSSEDRCGENIQLCRNFEDIDQDIMKKFYVVQEYIYNPLLIHGKKFTIRRHFHMFGLEPIITYVSTEGYVNLCGNPYQKPDEDNFADTFVHLTNQKMNRD